MGYLSQDPLQMAANSGGGNVALRVLNRFLQLCDAMRAGRVEPKRVRFVCARPDAAPKLVLVEGLKGGRPALHVLPMLITHDAQGNFTQEMRRIYGEAE